MTTTNKKINTATTITLDSLVALMEKNAENALDLLSILNEAVTDIDSYNLAHRIVDNYYHAGVISRRLRDHVQEELVAQYLPVKNNSSQRSDGRRYETIEDIREYISMNDKWVKKEILEYNSGRLQLEGNLLIALHCISSHLREGDIPANVADMASMWLVQQYSEYAPQ